ncbi:MAG: xanthine dehydrogenase family protein molybdopterin-binding subunit [Bacillota bacterium]|jgi:CO/xanthine dehydrogenase Mo-binding subunit
MKKLEHVGISSPIHDGMAKVSGELKYYGDLSFSNMHYAKVIFSRVPHAVVKAVNVEKASEIKGVVKVLSRFNTTDRKFCRSRVCTSEESYLQEQLFPRTVKFVGDRVAMVIAETPAAAEAGAELIEVEYEELPAVVTIAEASACDAPKLHKEGNIYEFEGMSCGKIPDDKNLAEIDAEIQTGALHHGAMELHGCIADYEKYSGKLTVYTPCQSVFAVRTGLADLFGLAYSKVRVLQTVMGGSFGSKQETTLEPLAAVAAMAVGAPVKLMYSREEVIASTIVKAPMHFSSRALVYPDGRIAYVNIDCTINAGAYLTNSLDYLYAMGDKISRLYDFPHINFTGRAICTNTPVSGSYRSWGSNDIAVPVEQILGEVAKKLNLDLLHIHKLNALKPYTQHRLSTVSVGDCRILQCFEQGGNAFSWWERKAECENWNRTHQRIKKGIGVSGGAHVNGFYPDMEFANVLLKLNEDGSILGNICLHDHGCGTITAFRKIIAEILLVDEEAVFLHRPDTDYNFYDYGCYGSRTVYVIGRAVQRAAERLLADLKARAAVMLNLSVDDIEQNSCFLGNPESGYVSYADISQRFQENSEDIYVTEFYRAVDNPTSSGAHFVQVAVDTLTGLTKVEKYYAVYDIGRAVNPGMCKAQIGGAAQQGIGAALTEDIVYDSVSGAIKNNNFHKYHLVNMPDMPQVEIDFIEHEGDNGPFGAKSIGETAIVPVMPAVIAAVENALGVETDKLPLTPVRIIGLLNKMSEGE